MLQMPRRGSDEQIRILMLITITTQQLKHNTNKYETIYPFSIRTWRAMWAISKPKLRIYQLSYYNWGKKWQPHHAGPILCLQTTFKPFKQLGNLVNGVNNDCGGSGGVWRTGNDLVSHIAQKRVNTLFEKTHFLVLLEEGLSQQRRGQSNRWL